MILPNHKTKIVATIGPASNSPEMLERLILAGMNIARLNFSHGTFDQHAEVIARIRVASKATGRRVAIMGDLPGPKMRLGTIDPEPIHLECGSPFNLTSEDVIGNGRCVSMSFEPLPRVVKPGDRLFLNDGLVQLLVDQIQGKEVHCTVAVGDELRSRKGLNLPRINLGISAFTDHDRKCLEFALACGIDAVSQSFVESAADLRAVRAAAAALGKSPFLIAKIERYESIERFDEILAAADGIMIARGPRRGSSDRGTGDSAKAAYRQGESGRQTGHHRHADAGVDDFKSPADPGRSHRRGKCHIGWHRFCYAFGRIGNGQISGGIRDDAGEDCCLYRDAPSKAIAGHATGDG